MSPVKPDYELTRVDGDETSEAPEIVPVDAPTGPSPTRRGFLGVGVGAAVALQELTSGTWTITAAPTREELALAAGCGDLISQDGPVYGIALAPDGTLLVSGTWNRAVPIWGLPEGALLKKVTVPGTSCRALAVHPDGKSMASASNDGAVVLWSLPDGNQLRVLRGASGPGSAAFSPDGKTLAVAGGTPPNAGSRTCELWDVATGARISTIGKNVCSVAFSPDGRWLAGGEIGVATLWGRVKGARTHRLTRLTGFVGAVAFTPDSKLIAVASTNKIELRRVSTGARVRSFVGHGGTVRGLAVTSDGRILASCSDDRTIKLWSLATGRLLTTIAEHTDRVNTVAITKDGRTLASGSSDRTIRLWSLPSGAAAGCLIDLTINPASKRGATITVTTAGRVVTYTLPCGSPIPAGAVCTCNCIPGGPPCACVGHVACTCVGHTSCTCVGYCSCVPVSHYWYPN